MQGDGAKLLGTESRTHPVTAPKCLRSVPSPYGRRGDAVAMPSSWQHPQGCLGSSNADVSLCRLRCRGDSLGGALVIQAQQHGLKLLGVWCEVATWPCVLDVGAPSMCAQHARHSEAPTYVTECACVKPVAKENYVALVHVDLISLPRHTLCRIDVRCIALFGQRLLGTTAMLKHVVTASHRFQHGWTPA